MKCKIFGGRFNREKYWFDQVEFEVPNQLFEKFSAMRPLFFFSRPLCIIAGKGKMFKKKTVKKTVRAIKK